MSRSKPNRRRDRATRAGALATMALVGATLMGCASGGGALPATDASGGDGKGLKVAGGPDGASYEQAAVGPWIGAAGANDLLMPGSQETSMGVWVDIPKVDRELHAPVSLSLVIDTSGSMAGEKIEHAREAARKLIDGMEDGDLVSVHTFSDSSEEWLPPTALDERTRQRIHSTLAELDVGGGTNLFEGLRAGEETAFGAPATHSVKRVVLISDGIATVGPTSPDRIGDIAERGAEEGIQVTALGVGLDYDETTLNELAMRSSGRLYHLQHSEQMAEVLADELDLLQATMATDAFVSVHPAPGVELVSVDGARFDRWQSDAMRVPLGTMHGGQHREVLVRLRVTAPQDGKHPLASVRLHFKDPAEGNVDRVQEIVARYEVTDDRGLALESVNARVRTIRAMIDAGKVAVQAAQFVNQDRFDDADRDLERAEEELLAAAEATKDASEKQRLMDTATGLNKARSKANAAAAAPPAARPAMKRESALDMNDAGMDAFGL